jgi:hypothetical protein
MFLQTVWPHLGGWLEESILKQSIEPMLSEMVPGLYFSRVSLGQDAIRMNGVKTMRREEACRRTKAENDVDDRVVEFAIDLEFPGEAVDIELALGPVFVGVRTLKFRGTMHVVMCSLAKGMPPMQAVRVTFANPPQIEINLSVEKVTLPFPMNLVEKTARSVLTNALVIPNCRVVNLGVPVDDWQTLVDLQYPRPVGVLNLHVKSGRNFPAADRGVFGLGTQKSSDCYLKLQVAGQESSTAVKYKTLAPEWDEHHEFIIDLAHTQDVFVEAWDEDSLTAHDLLASQRIAVWRFAEQVGVPALWPLVVADDFKEQGRKPEVLLASHFHPCTKSADSATESGSIGLVTIVVWSMSNWPAEKPLAIKADLTDKDGQTELGTYSRAALGEDTREDKVDVVKLMGRQIVKHADWTVNISLSEDPKGTGRKVWTCDKSKLTSAGDTYQEVQTTFHDKHTLRIACRFAFFGEKSAHKHEWAHSATELLDDAPVENGSRRVTLHNSADLDLD